VRLIVEREKEIRAFIPDEFWELDALLATPSKEVIKFEAAKYQNKEYRPSK